MEHGLLCRLEYWLSGLHKAVGRSSKSDGSRGGWHLLGWREWLQGCECGLRRLRGLCRLIWIR